MGALLEDIGGKILLAIILLILFIFMTSRYSYQESKIIGEAAIIEASLDLEYHYTLAGSIKVLDTEEMKNLDSNAEKLNELEKAFIHYNNTSDYLGSNIGNIIGIRHFLAKDSKREQKLIAKITSLKPLALSGMGNLSYNLLYILHLPSKIIHAVYFEANYMDTNFFLILWSIIKYTIYGLWGLIQAVVMGIVGTAIGLLSHPINTFTDIYNIGFPFIKYFWYAVKFIFVGY